MLRWSKPVLLTVLIAWVVGGYTTCDHAWDTDLSSTSSFEALYLGSVAHAHWDHQVKVASEQTTATAPGEKEWKLTGSIDGTYDEVDRAKIFGKLSIPLTPELTDPTTYSITASVDTICTCCKLRPTLGKETVPFTAVCSLCSAGKTGSKIVQYASKWYPVDPCTGAALAGCGE